MGSSTPPAKLSFRHAFYLVGVVRVADIIRVAWLVYVRTYCVPIATLNQNKRSRLLYLGDAQIIKGLQSKPGEQTLSIVPINLHG